MSTRIVLPAVLSLLVASLAVAGPQARISGTVVDSAGEPVSDAVITITSEEAPNYEKVIEVEADGGWKALILDATKSYLFTVEAPGYLSHKEPFKVPVGTMDNEFTFTLTTPEQRRAEEQQELLEQPGYKQVEEARKLLEAGDADAAVAKLEEGVQAVPDFVPAWVELAQLRYRAGETQAAYDAALECLRFDDEALRCVAVAANAAEELGLEEEHQRWMAVYQELNPGDPAALFNQAVVHINRLDDEAARPLLEACLEADPDFPRCLYEYGLLLLRAGDMAGAKERFERYLEVAPEGEDADTVRETLKYL